MEVALQAFFITESPERFKLFELLADDSNDVEWHAKDVCCRLIEKPLRISSSEHRLFLKRVKPGLTLGRVKSQTLACVVIDESTTMLVSHYDTLVSLLDVLLDTSFYAHLHSIREIPLNILKICLSKRGLRRFVFSNLSDECRSEIDAEDLRRKSDLGFEIYINSIDDLFEMQTLMTNDTPSPRMNGRYTRPSKRQKQPTGWTEIDTILNLFVERSGAPDSVQPTEYLIGVLLSAYNMLYVDISRIRESVLLHSVNQETASRALSMHSAFPTMLSLMAEEFDLRTLSRPMVRAYFADFPQLTLTLQNSANRLKAYLDEGDIIDPRFDQGLDVFGRRAGLFYDTVHNAHTGEHMKQQRHNWVMRKVSCIPATLLLTQLDEFFIFGGTALRLREFLDDRDRLEYFCYVFEKDSLFSLEAALISVRRWCDIDFLENYLVCPLPNGTGCAVVTTASVMLGLRMLAATGAFMAGRIEPVSYWRFCVRNLVHTPPNSCVELHDVAVACMAAAVISKLEDGRVLRSLRPPGSDLFYAYRLLPELCTAYSELPRHKELKKLRESVRVLFGSMCLRRKYTISRPVLHMVTEEIRRHANIEEYSGLREKLEKRSRLKRYLSQSRIPINIFYNNENPLHCAEIIRAMLDHAEPRLDRFTLLMKDLVVGAELKELEPRKPAKELDPCMGTTKTPTFEAFENAIRRTEDATNVAVSMAPDAVRTAYSYWVSRGFFVPSLHHRTGQQQQSRSEELPIELAAAALPERDCTKENIREHTSRYSNNSFISFLYCCFTDSDHVSTSALEELQNIVFTEEPKCLTLRLAYTIRRSCTELPAEESFMLGGVHNDDIEDEKTDSCVIGDRLALELVSQYAHRLVAGYGVTEKLDFNKSYLECIEHMQEMTQHPEIEYE